MRTTRLFLFSLAVAAALQSGAAPGQGERFWASRLDRVGPMFEGAVARGELSVDADREEILTMTAGPLYFRRLVASKRIDDDWVRAVVDQVWNRYCLKG